MSSHVRFNGRGYGIWPSAAPACLSARLALRPDQGIGVLIGCNRSYSRDTDYRPRGCPPNDPIGRRHRAPPIAKVLVSVISPYAQLV